MMIRTTINIALDVHQKLKEAASKHGMDVEDIILGLMRYFSRKYRKEIVAWEAVRYQERSEEAMRERVHVSWFGDEYEFLIDLRKVHKKSVSFLITEAVTLFLDKILSIFDSNEDNYQQHVYTIAKFSGQNVIGCIFLWEFPIKSLTK